MYLIHSVIDKWHHFDVMVALAIFVVYIFVDGAWAYYTLSVQKRKPASAATVGALMYFLLAFGVLNYVQNYLYLIPLALGSWIGTYLVVSNDVRSEVVDFSHTVNR